MSCPFFSSQQPIKQPFQNVSEPSSLDPEPFLSVRAYEVPYISPYIDLFHKFSLSKRTSEIPFHYCNSIFHNSYITNHRESEILNKISMANELREAGNRNFHKENYSNAVLCYEHAICLFKFLELQEDGSLILKTADPATEDFHETIGIISKLLENYALALTKMRHFTAAELLIEESKSLNPSFELVIIEAICKANNEKSGLAELFKYRPVFAEAGKSNAKYKQLEEKFSEILYEVQKKNCVFFNEFFSEFSGENGKKPSGRSFELEFNVVKNLGKKYLKMLEYYRDSEKLSDVISENSEIQRIYSEMCYIKSLKPSDSNSVMQSYAKSLNIDLLSPSSLYKFESAKKALICKLFNQGRFNKKLLYKCIQEVMTEFESTSESENNLENEYIFWKRCVFVLLVLAVLIYFSTTPKPFTY